MVKKTLSSEDTALFRKTIGKIKAIKSDSVLLTDTSKPKPYPQTQTLNTPSHFAEVIDSEIEKLHQEDSIRFIVAEKPIFNYPGFYNIVWQTVIVVYISFMAKVIAHPIINRC